MFIKRDATPPNIASVSVDPGVLWPPDRKMRPVAVVVDVSDVFDASPSCKIVSVNSNEPVNEKGGGNKAPDWEITWALGESPGGGLREGRRASVRHYG